MKIWKVFFYASSTIVCLVIALSVIGGIAGCSDNIEPPAQQASVAPELETPEDQLSAKLKRIFRDDFIEADISQTVMDLKGNLVDETMCLPVSPNEECGPPAWVVRVEFVASDNLTTGMTKRGIENEMMDGFEAVYTSGLPIKTATMEAQMTLVDSFGNDTPLRPVYGTRMNNDVGSKINWENKLILDKARLWTVYTIHREFRQ